MLGAIILLGTVAGFAGRSVVLEPSTTTTHSPLLKIVNHTGFIITVSVVLVLTALAAVAWYCYTRFYAVDSDEQKNQTTPTTEPKTPLASDAASTTSSNAPSS